MEWIYSGTHEEYLQNKKYAIDDSNSNGPKYDICYINSDPVELDEPNVIGINERMVSDSN